MSESADRLAHAALGTERREKLSGLGRILTRARRSGSLTHFPTEDVPVEIVGNRMDVSRKVLKKHYERRTEGVKLEQRRGYVDDVYYTQTGRLLYILRSYLVYPPLNPSGKRGLV